MANKKTARFTAFSSDVRGSSASTKKFAFITAGVAALICAACLAVVWTVAPRWQSPKQLLTFGASGTEPGQLYHPAYLGLDGHGNIYVADWDDGRINVFDPAGKFLHLIQLGDGTTILGMAVAEDGTVYVSYDGVVHRINPEGKDTVLAYKDSKGDLIADISGIALGPDGGLAAADNRGDVLRFDPGEAAHVVLAKAFNLPSFASQNEIHQGDAPIFSYDVPASSADKDSSVAVDESGNVYVVGWTVGVVIKTDAQGNSLSRFGGFASFPGGWQRGRFDFPDGLAADRYGRIYVADSSGLQVFSPQEQYLYSIHVPDGADALALDAQGNMYVLTTPYDHQLGALTDHVIKLAALKP